MPGDTIQLRPDGRQVTVEGRSRGDTRDLRCRRHSELAYPLARRPFRLGARESHKSLTAEYVPDPLIGFRRDPSPPRCSQLGARYQDFTRRGTAAPPPHSVEPRTHVRTNPAPARQHTFRHSHATPRAAATVGHHESGPEVRAGARRDDTSGRKPVKPTGLAPHLNPTVRRVWTSANGPR